jgi:hypothetical protein
MTTINDGGPAFPVPDSHHANGQVQYGANGMPLRDWFAGQALQGLASYVTQGATFDAIAKDAYAIADAMLKAREVKP